MITAQRFRRCMAAFGRAVVEGLAIENGWMWAYGAWCPTRQYWPRADALQPSGLREPVDDRP